MIKFLLKMFTLAALLITGSLWAETNVSVSGAQIYQTSKDGDSMTFKGKFAYAPASTDTKRIIFTLLPNKTYQTIMGFGAAFTESSAYLYNNLSKDKKKEFINAYFSTNGSGAGFTMMRTQLGGCDFSLSSYSYDEKEGDTKLKAFTIEHDKKWLIPLIKDAQKAPGAGFTMFASPWSPPAWMKNNKNYVNGNLLKENYPVYANYFVKYLKAYQKEGIPIWGITIQNEPQHGGIWDTCVWNPREELDFIKSNIGPLLKKEKMNTKIMIYDHNKDNILEWAYTMYQDPEAAQYCWGTAFHWYDTFYGVSQKGGKPHYNFDALKQVHDDFTNFHLMHTEACTSYPITGKAFWELSPDWTGYLHIPAERYGNDIIGDLNNWTEGWVEWNLLLNMEGLPNHANNANSAPIMVNETNQVFTYNPSYYILAQFSKFIRPGAKRIDMMVGTNETQAGTVIATAFKNLDGKIVVEMLNTNDTPYTYQIQMNENNVQYQVDPHALQTVVLE